VTVVKPVASRENVFLSYIHFCYSHIGMAYVPLLEIIFEIYIYILQEAEASQSHLNWCKE
jgi:hypothetical protein